MLSTQHNWEDDNTHLDDAAILCSIAKISRDVEMLQASVLGNRRSREFTPGSADRNRPDKFIRIEETPARPLDFSQSMDLSAEYENWDVERYIQARHFSARHRFWQLASNPAKEKMVRALYDQPAGTHATIQARENGWIPN